MKLASRSICVPSVEAPAVIATEHSYNSKLSTDRSCSTTSASQASCPKTCALMNEGCFAENYPFGMFTKLLNRSVIRDPDKIACLEARAIDSLTGRHPLRLHIVGDVTTLTGLLRLAGASRRYTARGGQPVWSYTHAWKSLPAILWNPIKVLASCHTVQEVRLAHFLGYAAALVVERFEDAKVYQIGRGLRGLPCPQETGRKRSCVDCQACWHPDRLRASKTVILFEAHGSQKEKVRKVLRVLNDPERKKCR